MRIKCAKFLAFLVVFVNIVIVYYSLRLFVSLKITLNDQAFAPSALHKKHKDTALQDLGGAVTIILREFERQENDVVLTVQSFLRHFPTNKIMILYDSLPYPPLDLTLLNSTAADNVKTINLTPRLRHSFRDHLPIMQIETRYVLFIPDSTRVANRTFLRTMFAEIEEGPFGMVAAPVGAPVNCLTMNVNIREWTLNYSVGRNEECDAVSGKHVILMETELLKQVAVPFSLPFPQALYLQTASISKKVRLLSGVHLREGKALFKSYYAKRSLLQVESGRLKALYSTFQIKQVVRESGAVEWYGCSRGSARCFGPVVDAMPSYLFEGKWTPPCCLSNLRKTAKHVFDRLQERGVRFWLEAGSLLGAMRRGDVLPWAHDVDVGFNRDDLERSPWLSRARVAPTLDSEGFLWERAAEGNFYRVFYSEHNRIAVNLLPFLLQNGTMVRDNWPSRGRNMEFPEHFLHPMSSIEFMGRAVPSPNNIRDFLELKLGPGAVERPQYPDPRLLAFP